jgi:hypothetical protein
MIQNRVAMFQDERLQFATNDTGTLCKSERNASDSHRPRKAKPST